MFIADWLSRQNHKENKDAEIPGMQLNNDAIHANNIPDFMKIHKLQQTTSQDEYLQYLQEPIIQGWPEDRRSNTARHENILDFSR